MTLASMLLTLVGLSILLVVSDANASGSGFPQQSQTTGASDGITSFAVDTAPTLRVIGGAQTTRRAYVIISKTGTQVFVYTRNADGILTDPD